jgi:hypothetical protein
MCQQSDIVPKFATASKFATGINNTNSTDGKYATGVVDTGGKFAASVIDKVGPPWLANISAYFRKNYKWP